MLCLEYVAERNDPFQVKAITFLVDSYVAIDNMAMVGKKWETIIIKFPETPFAVEAQRRALHEGIKSSDFTELHSYEN